MPSSREKWSRSPRALGFKSILLREPAIVSDSIEDASLAATLASLAPMALRPPPEEQTAYGDSTHQHQADDCRRRTPLPSLIGRRIPALQRWESIQLSIKDFTNDRLFPTEVESSFRLSGRARCQRRLFHLAGHFRQTESSRWQPAAQQRTGLAHRTLSGQGSQGYFRNR